MIVQPSSPKYKIVENEDGLVFIIPSLKFLPLLMVLGIWSLMFLVLETIILVTVFSGKIDLSGIIFALFLNVIGLFILYHFLWQLIGKEEIQITNSSIKISQVVLGYKRSKEYLLEYIKNFGLARVSTKDIVSHSGPFLSTSSIGTISFDYGAKTFRFAGSIDEAEGKMIIAKIQEKYPQYKK